MRPRKPSFTSVRAFVVAALAVSAVVSGVCFAGADAASANPKIAVYAFGADVPAVNKAMATRLIAGLSNTGRYQTAENYKEFFNRVDVEPRGKSGLVSSKQIVTVAKRFGLDYVCVAEILSVYGERQVSAHILRVSDGSVAAIGGGGVVLKTFADLTIASENIVTAMFGSVASPGYAAESAFVDVTDWTKSAFTDPRDGKVYKTATIGAMVWMAQNLNYGASTASWCYGGDNANCNKYGRLYDWNAATSACPPGWSLPSRLDWDDLASAAAGGSALAGRELKSISGWSFNSRGLDDYGFSALPGGNRDTAGVYSGINGSGFWWTGTPATGKSAYYRYIYHDVDALSEYTGSDKLGLSVRCIQK